MHMFIIRRFETRDAEAVSDIIRLAMGRLVSRDYPIERLQPLIDYFEPQKIASLSLERSCFVAEDDSLLVGTAALEGSDLCTFFVHPDHQRIGVGSQLLRAIEVAAQRVGIDRLRVEASLAGAGFYEHHGYRATGAILESTAGPHVEMEKSLEPR